MNENANAGYEVLSPWAEADPVPFRGINERITEIPGKTIGLLCNSKRVAEPTMKVIEKRLKDRFPAAVTTWFYNTVANETLVAQPRKEEFEDWLKGVDAVVAAYGD